MKCFASSREKKGKREKEVREESVEKMKSVFDRYAQVMSAEANFKITSFKEQEKIQMKITQRLVKCTAGMSSSLVASHLKFGHFSVMQIRSTLYKLATTMPTLHAEIAPTVNKAIINWFGIIPCHHINLVPVRNPKGTHEYTYTHI